MTPKSHLEEAKALRRQEEELVAEIREERRAAREFVGLGGEAELPPEPLLSRAARKERERPITSKVEWEEGESVGAFRKGDTLPPFTLATTHRQTERRPHGYAQVELFT